MDSMSSSIRRRPGTERRSSRIPGEFEPDEDVSPVEDVNGYDVHDTSEQLTFLHPGPHDENSGVDLPNDTALEEQEINNKLLEVESSFLPELSHLTSHGAPNGGVDDTLLFGVPNRNLAVRKKPHPIQTTGSFLGSTRDISGLGVGSVPSPRTPPGAYKTPAPEEQYFHDMDDKEDATPEIPNTSSLETMSSSPTAAAAARTVSRVQSMTTLGGYETADEREYPDSPSKKAGSLEEDMDATPRKNRDGRFLDVPDTLDGQKEGAADSGQDQVLKAKRPKYLHKRSSQARLSYDSMASSNTDASDATLGADFALQSGGALPEPRLQRKTRVTLSRQTSLGSMLSGISGASDDDGRVPKSVGVPDLSTLEEESPRSNAAGRRTPTGPSTPRASIHITMPTDTVIANNARDLEVPGTFARQYRQEQSMSPEKSLTVPGMTPGPKRGLTLKEHRSTVEKLGKENFDLKMKIHFLDQALQKRSEDGVKEMITENVQLKSDRLRLEKENHNLRKQVRELQRKIEENGRRESPGADQGYGTDEERSPTIEEEVLYLRERVETTEIEIEKLRAENLAKETEKRRLAEMVKSLGDTRAGISDVGSREERDMWKDMLEAETIAREQSEEDNKRLREEIAKLRNETFGSGRSLSRKQRVGGSVVSRSSSVEAAANAQNAELERLRHEISELQKTIGAQASALTSRNKEKERLYQEIEDLKLGRMGGLRSVAGDSILDRSASRARSHSRASNGTRLSRLSDQERESLEARINELRDELSQLKLENQNLQSQFDEALAELEAVDAQAQADADQFNEELHLLTQERDNALQDAEEQDKAFQQLKAEAQDEIDGLGDELDAKIEECARLEQDLKIQADNVQALQSEMRSAAEGLVRLEEDAQQNLAQYQAVKAELDDANRELENLEKNMAEAESKIQRLTVQQESSHNEIAFLREEQDGDKIKIGDLESLLKKVHLNLESERDKARELERRIAEERQQSQAAASQEKQEVQRIINDLNREATNAKDELRKVRKALSSREIESNTYHERLTELEDSLRNIIGDPNGTRSSLISSVTKMQRELDQTSVDLEATRRRLDERETLLANRDALLESSGLEYRKLADALDRERQARRQDKHSFEQSLKSHQQSARALTANHSRIAELEHARQVDRKRLAQLESQLKDQLAERNQVLLTIWKKLSAMCGPDWAHNNSLINGNLPSQEVIGNMLFWPGFSRNLLLAAKQVEGTLATFKDKIKRVERDLWKEYQSLEQTLEVRTRKLERIEESWEKMKLQQAEMEANVHASSRGSKSSRASELSKLKGENRLLKAELQLLQQQQQHHHMHHRRERAESRGSAFSGAATVSHDGPPGLDGMVNGTVGVPARSSSMRRGIKHPELQRHHSAGIIEQLTTVNGGDMRSMRSNSISSRHSGLTQHDRDRGLMIPAGPFNAPANGNFALPPPREAPPAPPSTASGSDIGSITAVSMSGPGQEKWIHRLRELERRLKAEREARLLDRSGARKRLEERDAVNEELRRELERERVRRSVENAEAMLPPLVAGETRAGEVDVERRSPQNQ